MTQEGVIKAAQRYGLPTVVALLLGYILIGEVRADQKLIKEQHIALTIEQQNLARGVLKLADRQGETQMLQEKILRVMQAMCIQGATNQADRRECMKE